MQPTHTPIVPRDRAIQIPADLPRYWHGGRRSLTLFMNGLSIFFPLGERFFILSVKAYAERIKEQAAVRGDRTLVEEVENFIKQEGYHSREHTRYNQILAAQGYPIAQMEDRVRRLLDLPRKRAPKRRQLAITCALEHFTALLAQPMLADPRLLDGAHPKMADLWRWHAVEETEHKAVAFDVYKAVGGRYLERVLVMLVTSAFFLGKIIEHQIRLMAHDGILTDVREWAALFRFLYINPGGMLKLIPGYLAYFRPDFHPWQMDNRDLVASWQVERQAQESG